MADKLTASEALYGFVGWITTQTEPIIASSHHDAGVWADLVSRFCEVNSLADPRENWAENLIHPTDDALSKPEPADIYSQLSDELKQPAIEMLRRELGSKFVWWYRKRKRLYDDEWWLPGGWHFSGGMAIRNLLRERGFGEEHFGIGNLDDIYIHLVEDAFTNEDMPPTGIHGVPQ